MAVFRPAKTAVDCTRRPTGRPLVSRTWGNMQKRAERKEKRPKNKWCFINFCETYPVMFFCEEPLPIITEISFIVAIFEPHWIVILSIIEFPSLRINCQSFEFNLNELTTSNELPILIDLYQQTFKFRPNDNKSPNLVTLFVTGMTNCF